MTAQLTLCHVFITDLVMCKFFATLNGAIQDPSAVFKHRGKDKLNTWKMLPLTPGFTGVNVKSAEDTITECCEAGSDKVP